MIKKTGYPKIENYNMSEKLLAQILAELKKANQQTNRLINEVSYIKREFIKLNEPAYESRDRFKDSIKEANDFLTNMDQSVEVDHDQIALDKVHIGSSGPTTYTISHK